MCNEPNWAAALWVLIFIGVPLVALWVAICIDIGRKPPSPWGM